MTDLDRLRGKGFVVFGRAGIDLQADPPGTRLERADRFEATLGGAAANIAAGLVRLGCDAALLTRLSDDAVGHWCLNRLDAHGIDRRFVGLAGGEARTSLAMVDSRPVDTRSVIYRNGAADFAITPAEVARVPWRGFSALVVTGTALAAEPSRAAGLRAAALGREAGLPLVLDLDYRPYSWASPQAAAEVCAGLAAQADIVVGNDAEFALLAGAGGDGPAAARALVAAGVQIVVYKMGEKGAITLTARGETRSGVFAARPLKPTGAGDAFLAALLAGLAEGRPLPKAVLRGSAAAAIVVGRVGCAPASPTLPELDAFLAGNAIRPAPQEHAMHIPPHDNANRPIVPEDHPLVPLVYFNIVRLAAGQSLDYRLDGYESCVVPATGTVSVAVEDASGPAVFADIGNRGADVWDGEPEGVYVPTGAAARITARTDTETFVAGARFATRLRPFAVRAADLDVVQYGSDETKTHRKIKHILGANHHGRVGRLLVSELFTVGTGGWSGFPSHKHDTDRQPDETRHDEAYNFRFRPARGSGLQMLQRDDGVPGEAYHVVDGSTVLIDRGYHPCAVLPGYEMYYFTILGGLSQRSLKQFFQPAHADQLHTIPGILDMVARFK